MSTQDESLFADEERPLPKVFHGKDQEFLWELVQHLAEGKPLNAWQLAQVRELVIRERKGSEVRA